MCSEVVLAANKVKEAAVLLVAAVASFVFLVVVVVVGVRSWRLCLRELRNDFQARCAKTRMAVWTTKIARWLSYRLFLQRVHGLLRRTRGFAHPHALSISICSDSCLLRVACKSAVIFVWTCVALSSSTCLWRLRGLRGMGG